MFFSTLGFLFFLLGLVPLGLTLAHADRMDPPERRRKLRLSFLVVLADIAVLVLFNIFFHYYTELLWFKNLGYGDRFWTVVVAQIILWGIGALSAGIFLLINNSIAHRWSPTHTGPSRFYAIAAVAALMGFWLSSLWEETLRFVYQQPSAVQDPIFGLNASFYLFSLPFQESLVGWVTIVLLLGIGAAAVPLLTSISGTDRFSIRWPGVVTHGLILTAFLLLIVIWRSFLALFNLLLSQRGVVVGAGWTDVNITRVGYIITIGILVLVTLALILAAVVPRFRPRLDFRNPARMRRLGIRAGIGTAVVVVLILSAVWFVPSILQAVYVSPNEITLERPYLSHNIELTRHSYGIDDERVTEKKFTINRSVSREDISGNRKTLDNVRLWDWRALMANLRQQQEIRLYYRFNDVDIDRYAYEDKYRQVMLSVREIDQQELDPRSRNWVSERLKYTHGYGMVALPSHEFLPQGKPKFLLYNIPVVEEVRDLTISQPRIYYGELTNNTVYVGTTQEEFDYPIGDRIAYNTYDGDGGVSVGSLFNRFAYAWKFDDYRLLLSGYFTPQSRTLFRRQIVDRAKSVLPFLEFDRDPYAVLAEDGGIAFMLDAYTLSTKFPYSQIYRGMVRRLNGINYIRNSVKVVIDAYDGSVTPYIVDSSDVIVRTYDKIFPDLFRSFEQMPKFFQEHIRYPVDFFTVQADMYTAYHMVDPAVFYQREDLWEFATERYRDDFQPVTPYFIMTTLPPNGDLEMVQMVPFTPKNKNVMRAWMAGRCDMPNYGKLMVFPFPKGVEVLGPRQIEARIDQNTTMSQAMTLWGQRGSAVLRGNLLVIPLFNGNELSILYVEPIFLEAEEAQLPEIKRIIVADQERVVWSEEFDQSLQLLLGDEEPMRAEDVEAGQAVEDPEILSRAREHIEAFKRLWSEGDYSAAGERLEQLEELLQE